MDWESMQGEKQPKPLFLLTLERKVLKDPWLAPWPMTEGPQDGYLGIWSYEKDCIQATSPARVTWGQILPESHFPGWGLFISGLPSEVRCSPQNARLEWGLLPPRSLLPPPPNTCCCSELLHKEVHMLTLASAAQEERKTDCLWLYANDFGRFGLESGIQIKIKQVFVLGLKPHFPCWLPILRWVKCGILSPYGGLKYPALMQP